MKMLPVLVFLFTGLTLQVSRSLSVSASASADVAIVAGLKSDTGTLIAKSNVPETDLFINNQKHTIPAGAQVLAIALPPNTYYVRAARKGYVAYGPVPVSIAKDAALMLNIELKPENNCAVLQIQGATPGTQIRVDGAPLGSPMERESFVREILPGRHVIELSKLRRVVS
jgi:hypothetical protein